MFKNQGSVIRFVLGMYQLSSVVKNRLRGQGTRVGKVTRSEAFMVVLAEDEEQIAKG